MRHQFMFCYQTLPRWALFTVDHRGVVCLHAKLWMNIAVVYLSVYCLSSLTLICWLQAKLWMHIAVVYLSVYCLSSLTLICWLQAKLWMHIAVVYLSVYCLSSLTLICWLQAKLWMNITIIFNVVMRLHVFSCSKMFSDHGFTVVTIILP